MGGGIWLTPLLLAKDRPQDRTTFLTVLRPSPSWPSPLFSRLPSSSPLSSLSPLPSPPLELPAPPVRAAACGAAAGGDGRQAAAAAVAAAARAGAQLLGLSEAESEDVDIVEVQARQRLAQPYLLAEVKASRQGVPARHPGARKACRDVATHAALGAGPHALP